MSDPNDNPQVAREQAEPQELARPMPRPLLVVVFTLVIFGVVYILQSGPAQPPEFGDRRTPEDLAAKVAAGGKADGAAAFAALCAACHQATGAGLPGVFPPLAGSEWVTGKAEIPIQIVLHGIQGTLTVKAVPYNGQMPAFGQQLSDDEIAAVVTYVRRQWGNAAAEVAPATVTEQRHLTSSRTAPWNGDAELAAMR
jgi:mono/diheme cytochrome c family protein